MSTVTTQDAYSCPSPPPAVVQDAPSVHVEHQETTTKENEGSDTLPSSPGPGSPLGIRSSPTLANQEVTLVLSPGANSETFELLEQHTKEEAMPNTVHATIEIIKLHGPPSCHDVAVPRTVGTYKSGEVGLGMYLLF